MSSLIAMEACADESSKSVLLYDAEGLVPPTQIMLGRRPAISTKNVSLTGKKLTRSKTKLDFVQDSTKKTTLTGSYIN